MKIINTLWDAFSKTSKSEQFRLSEEFYESIKEMIDSDIIKKDSLLSDEIQVVNTKNESVILKNIKDLLFFIAEKYPTEKLVAEVPRLYNQTINDELVLSNLKKKDLTRSFEDSDVFKEEILPLFNATSKEMIIKSLSNSDVENKKIINTILNLIIKDEKIYSIMETLTGKDFLKDAVLNMEIMNNSYKDNIFKCHIENMFKVIPELKNHKYENELTILEIALKKNQDLFNEYINSIGSLDKSTNSIIKKVIQNSNNPLRNKIWLYENWYTEEVSGGYKDILDKYLAKYTEIEIEDFKTILSIAKKDNEFKSFLKERESNILLNLFKCRNITKKIIADYLNIIPELKDKKSDKKILKNMLCDVPYDIKVSEMNAIEFILNNINMEVLLGSNEKNFNEFPWMDVFVKDSKVSYSVKCTVRHEVSKYSGRKGYDKVNVHHIDDSYSDLIKISGINIYSPGGSRMLIENSYKLIKNIDERSLPLSFFEHKKIKELIDNIEVLFSNAKRKMNKDINDSFKSMIQKVKLGKEKNILLENIKPENINENKVKKRL